MGCQTWEKNNIFVVVDDDAIVLLSLIFSTHSYAPLPTSFSPRPASHPVSLAF